jgi:hypothetical protein
VREVLDDQLSTKKVQIFLSNPGPLEKDPFNRNLLLWGDPGTGRTYWDHALCAEFAVLRGQNKWSDGPFSEVPPTGILWNDVQPLGEFNLLTLPDVGDGYAFIAEVKFGCRLIDPGQMPVIWTCGYAPEELPAGIPETRIHALKRRLRLVEMRWAGNQRGRILRVIHHGPGPVRDPPPRPGLEFVIEGIE